MLKGENGLLELECRQGWICFPNYLKSSGNKLCLRKDLGKILKPSVYRLVKNRWDSGQSITALGKKISFLEDNPLNVGLSACAQSKKKKCIFDKQFLYILRLKSNNWCKDISLYRVLHMMINITINAQVRGGGDGGGTRILVLYTCAIRETRKRVVFLDWMWFSRIAIRACFQEKESF